MLLELFFFYYRLRGFVRGLGIDWSVGANFCTILWPFSQSEKPDDRDSSLAGSAGRIPAGLLADRFGGRRVFAALLLLAAIPAVLIGVSNSYVQLLSLGLFLGIAGSTFPVGVGFMSKWFTPDQQGTALGVYGMGNIGQSAAVFLGRSLPRIGMHGVFRSAVDIGAGLSFTSLLAAPNPPVEVKPKTMSAIFSRLRANGWLGFYRPFISLPSVGSSRSRSTCPPFEG